MNRFTVMIVPVLLVVLAMSVRPVAIAAPVSSDAPPIPLAASAVIVAAPAPGDPHDLILSHATLEPTHATGASYRAGSPVRIVADLAPEGTHFTGWACDPPLTLKDPTSAHTAFTMPDTHQAITAQYQP